MKKALIVLLATLAVTSLPKAANAVPILGGQLFYSGGEITVTTLDGSAAYHSYLGLYLLDPMTQQGDDIGENHQTGDSVTLDPSLLGYALGDELIFGISIFTGGWHDDPDNFLATFVMGAGSRNPDGIMHAILNTDDESNYIVSFEDLYGGGDRDFNDSIFSFSGGITTSVPEPGTLLLFGVGLLGIGAHRHMKAKA